MLLCGTLSYAQKSNTPAKDNEPKADYSFRSIAVSADIFGLASSPLNDYTSSEFAIEANFGNRIYPTVVSHHPKPASTVGYMRLPKLATMATSLLV